MSASNRSLTTTPSAGPLSPALVAWCRHALKTAWSDTHHMRAMSVVTRDGFEVAGSQLRDPLQRRLATVAGALNAVSLAAARETRLGAPDTVLVSAAGGLLSVTPFDLAGQPLLLVQVGGTRATAGAMYVHAKEFAERASTLALR